MDMSTLETLLNEFMRLNQKAKLIVHANEIKDVSKRGKDGKFDFFQYLGSTSIGDERLKELNMRETFQWYVFCWSTEKKKSEM